MLQHLESLTPVYPRYSEWSITVETPEAVDCPDCQMIMRDEAERRVCDCPEPCDCYADGYSHGKDKLEFKIRSLLAGGGHACGCRPCLIIHAAREALR